MTSDDMSMFARAMATGSDKLYKAGRTHATTREVVEAVTWLCEPDRSILLDYLKDRLDEVHDLQMIDAMAKRMGQPS